MPALDTAALRRWHATAPDGTEHTLVLRVGVPREDDGMWQADVEVGVPGEPAHVIAGHDAWQALVLALRFAATRLGHFADRGWTFRWEPAGARVQPADLLDAGWSDPVTGPAAGESGNRA